jgi:hypothetical protein
MGKCRFDSYARCQAHFGPAQDIGVAAAALCSAGKAELEARLEETRGLVRDLTTVLEKRNSRHAARNEEFARLVAEADEVADQLATRDAQVGAMVDFVRRYNGWKITEDHETHLGACDRCTFQRLVYDAGRALTDNLGHSAAEKKVAP